MPFTYCLYYKNIKYYYADFSDLLTVTAIIRNECMVTCLFSVHAITARQGGSQGGGSFSQVI